MERARPRPAPPPVSAPRRRWFVSPPFARSAVPCCAAQRSAAQRSGCGCSSAVRGRTKKRNRKRRPRQRQGKRSAHSRLLVLAFELRDVVRDRLEAQQRRAERRAHDQLLHVDLLALRLLVLHGRVRLVQDGLSRSARGRPAREWGLGTYRAQAGLARTRNMLRSVYSENNMKPVKSSGAVTRFVSYLRARLACALQGACVCARVCHSAPQCAALCSALRRLPWSFTPPPHAIASSRAMPLVSEAPRALRPTAERSRCYGAVGLVRSA